MAQRLVPIPNTDRYQIEPSTPSLREQIQKRYDHPLGEKELFGDETALGFGTAFLITKRTILTAAHCVCFQDSANLNPAWIQTMRIVFHFYPTAADQSKKEWAHHEIYHITNVLDHQYERETGWSDWALLQLDKEVEGSEPLLMNFSHLPDAQGLYMLGHPGGIYQKHTWGCHPHV